MQIDWFTFIAQVVNFLILLVLLHRLLYGRILDAMDAREARIAERLAEAHAQGEAAAKEKAAYEAKRTTLAEQQEALLDKARADAEAQRKVWLQEARAEIDRLEARWRDALQRDQQTVLHTLAQRTEEHLLETARRVLRDLASASLEDQVVHVFLAQLQELGADERADLAALTREAGRDLVVRTRFPLDEAAQQRITAAWEEVVGAAPAFRFVTVPEVGFGIEVKTVGRKMGWSLAGYLGQLEERVAEALDEALTTAAPGAALPPELPNEETEEVPS